MIQIFLAHGRAGPPEVVQEVLVDLKKLLFCMSSGMEDVIQALPKRLVLYHICVKVKKKGAFRKYIYCQ